mmetsp:Transcript_15711/g.25445  ORF Transcript_15711/g.25445 Transcript_15711/m.25445 type:complete len:447 (-) Transcript_15711:192-1532(-)
MLYQCLRILETTDLIQAMRPSATISMPIKDGKATQSITRASNHITQVNRGTEQACNSGNNMISTNEQVDEGARKRDEDDNDDGLKNKNDKRKKMQIKVMPEDVGPYDVLGGRHKEVFNFVGNRRFRLLVSNHLSEYDVAETKTEKANVIMTLCHKLKNEEGMRFLKRQQGNVDEGEYYIELSDAQVRKKVGHCLRDMSVARQQVTVRRQSLVSENDARSKDKKIKNPSSDEEEDGDGRSVSSEETNGLRELTTMLLPYVSQDFEDVHENLMEPLPLGRDGDREDLISPLAEPLQDVPHDRGNVSERYNDNPVPPVGFTAGYATVGEMLTHPFHMPQAIRMPFGPNVGRELGPAAFGQAVATSPPGVPQAWPYPPPMRLYFQPLLVPQQFNYHYYAHDIFLNPDPQVHEQGSFQTSASLPLPTSNSGQEEEDTERFLNSERNEQTEE